MYNKKMQYVIKTVPTNDKQALEDLLNGMSEDGWDLYTMHEIESEDSIDFNCIFMREKQEDVKTDLDDIVNVTSFKYRMEKMLAAPTSPYESCKEIQLKISNQKDRIKRIKAKLDSEGLSVSEKNRLNDQMSDELRQLDALKQALMNEISPDTMYSGIKEERVTINLSEEILELVSMVKPDNLLAQTVKIRQNLTDELGYVIPHIHFHNSDDLNQNEFNIKIHDIESFRGIVFTDRRAFYKDDLKGYKLEDDDITVVDPMTNKKIIWINESRGKSFWAQGLTASEYIGKAIEYVAIKEVSDIMDYNDVNKYVEIVIENNSFLVDNIIPDFITASDLKYLLSCLIRERVSIKNIVYLFEKINDYANEPTKEDLLDKVRLAFSKLIVKDLMKDGQIKIIDFSDETLETIENFFEQEDDGDSVIRIDANDVQKIASKINKLAKTKKLDKPIVSVPMHLRHMVFVILSEFVPNITVLATEELVTDCDVIYIGKV